MSAGKYVRFGWIEAAIRYAGRFGPSEKKAFEQVFGQSQSTISRYQEEFAKAFEEEFGTKVFERNLDGGFQGHKLELISSFALPEEHVFGHVPSLDRWLRDAMPPGKYVEAEISRQDPPPWVVRIVIRALRDKCPVRVRYHSRRGSEERIVSPHAIVRVAGRMHIRAMDHRKNKPRDLVLSRMTSAALWPEKYRDASEDKEWRRFCKIEIVETVKGDDEAGAAGVRMDFGLDERGRREMRVSEALVQYLVDEMDEGYRSPVRVKKKDAGK